MNIEKVLQMPFSTIYPLYLQKAERKGRTQQEVNTIISWLTGYDTTALQQQITQVVSLEQFFQEAPQWQSKASLIKGSICGYKVEEIKDEMMWKIRCLDKLIDELAKGKSLEKILRA